MIGYDTINPKHADAHTRTSTIVQTVEVGERDRLPVGEELSAAALVASDSELPEGLVIARRDVGVI